MSVKETIEQRRAYRVIKDFEVTEELIDELIYSASLAPSCYNNQPWRYVFVYEDNKLEELHEALSDGNEWAKKGAIIVAVFSNREEDCNIGKREYHLFDTGISVGFMVLRAHEMGLVAHPIAGYDEGKAKQILGIPDDDRLITLIVIGKHDKDNSEAAMEDERPERLSFDRISYRNNVS